MICVKLLCLFFIIFCFCFFFSSRRRHTRCALVTGVQTCALPISALNPTKVDNSTDAWDTIDWLVKNVKESNGRVGIIGISYDGFLSLTALIHPHPALKVAVPMNPMVDGWRGDDWLHNGAFRQQNLPYILEKDASRDNDRKSTRMKSSH